MFESVQLPANIQKIGNFAFVSNALTSITLPESLIEIGMQAFALNDLSEVDLPDGLTTLGGAAFSNNIHLQSVELGKKLTSIPATAFGITGMNVTNASLTRVIVPEGVTSIGNGAFGGHEIQTLVLPSTLKKIDSKAFNGNQLETVIIPPDVTELGSTSFAQTAGKNKLSSVKLQEGLQKIGSKAFANASFTRVDIPFSITKLDKATFDGNKNGKVQVYTPNDEHTSFAVSGATFDIHIRTDIWTVNDFTYEGTVVTGLTEKGINKRAENHALVIPNKNKEGNYITEIAAPESGGYGTFGEESNLFESVVLPVKLEKIGDRAFQNNRLTEVTFPETLKEIGLAAFQSNQLVSVVLPDSVTTLGGGAFATNKTLQNVVISKNLKTIPSGAFGCSTKTDYMEGFTSVVIPEGITSIGDNAFAGNNFAEINIPSTVTSIGRLAFSTKKTLTGKTTVTLPEGLEKIGSYAFRNKNIESINLPYSVGELSDNTFLKDYEDGAITKVRVESYVQYTDKNKFPDSEHHQYEVNADRYTVHDFTFNKTTVTGHSEDGIMKRPLNKNLTIPDQNTDGENVTEISAGVAGSFGTFGKKDEIYDSVTLPNKLEKIGNYAFRANKLQTIALPETLEEIGIQAFAENTLTEVVIPDSVTTLGGGAFTSNPTLTKVVLSNGLTTIAQTAFSMNIELTYVKIPDTITDIGDFSFAGARLETLDIPKSVTRIGKKAFHLHHLSELVIPGNVKEIGESAFEGTFKAITLKKLTLEEGIEKIGALAFKEGYLETVKLPSSLLSLASDAFYHNAGVDNDYVVRCYTTNPAHMKFQNSASHKIVLRTTEWTVEDFTFGMVAVQSEAITNPETTITGLSESGLEKLKSFTDLVLPQKNAKGEVITAIGEYAFANLPVKLTSVTFADGLEHIGTGSFMGNLLQELILPESLKTIGDQAFSENRVTELTLPEKVESIGKSAFDGNKDADGNEIKVKVYITNEEQNKIPGSDGFDIIEKPVEPPVDPEKPAEPENPVTPDKPTTPDKPGTSGTDTNKNQTVKSNTTVKAVKTGDSQNPAGTMAVMLLAVFVMAACMRKKNEEGKEK